MRSRLIVFLILVFSLGFWLSACNSNNPSNSSQITYQMSPSFRELYEKLGGEDVLGPAISKNIVIQSYECQYTVNALICVNPQEIDADRLFFFPVANTMGVKEDPSQSPAQPGSTTIDGYTIYDEFIPLYDQLSGQKFVGRPLTQAHINYSQQRIEQYFENLGFYRKFSDPAGTVHLLAYGAYHCSNKCSYTPLVEASILNAAAASQDQPMLAGLSKNIDTSILGNAITQPYIAADGMEEQVYENAVITAPVNDLASVQFRPLSILLDLPRSDPGPQKYSSNDGMVFYRTNGADGYHVPLVFDQFIAAHGGTKYSGDPIADVFQYQENIFRQCFENYCLDYDTLMADGNKVRLANLGYQYLQQVSSSSGSTQLQPAITAQTVLLQASELNNEISADDSQKIDILVTRKDNQQPLPNINAVVSIDLPDGSKYNADFAATGLDGRSSLVIPAMQNLSNGTILLYQVCLQGVVGDPICVSDSYLIWSNSR